MVRYSKFLPNMAFTSFMVKVHCSCNLTLCRYRYRIPDQNTGWPFPAGMFPTGSNQFSYISVGLFTAEPRNPSPRMYMGSLLYRLPLDAEFSKPRMLGGGLSSFQIFPTRRSKPQVSTFAVALSGLRAPAIVMY